MLLMRCKAVRKNSDNGIEGHGVFLHHHVVLGPLSMDTMKQGVKACWTCYQGNPFQSNKRMSPGFPFQERRQNSDRSEILYYRTLAENQLVEQWVDPQKISDGGK